jgi:hypothetical protein
MQYLLSFSSDRLVAAPEPEQGEYPDLSTKHW